MDVVYVKYNANVPVGGGAFRTVLKGEHWSAGDPVVAAMPEAFSPDPRYGLQWTGSPPAELAEAPVEQATAGPGEKRTTRRG